MTNTVAMNFETLLTYFMHFNMLTRTKDYDTFIKSAKLLILAKIVSFDSFMFNKANVQHANTMSISCCVAYNVFIRCSYKYFHKNELYENVQRRLKIQIIFFRKMLKFEYFIEKIDLKIQFFESL